jgi:hypothetical protein
VGRVSMARLVVTAVVGGLSSSTRAIPAGRPGRVRARARGSASSSDGFNGYSRFSFEVEREALRSMTIMA